jgi:ABC-type multidrug transport system fused ATPase/permease subunit
VGLLAVQAGLSFFRILWFVEVGERALADLRQDVYRRMIEFPMAFFGQRRVGELASRLSSDVSTIQDTFTTTLAEGIRSVINLIVCMGLILYTSVKLTLFMLAMLPVVIVVAIFFGRFIRKISREAQDKLAETNVIVEETLQGIQNVKSFTNELYERARYGSVLQDFVRIVLRLAVYRGAFASFIIFALFGVIIGMLWYGIRLVEVGEMTIGQLTSFIFFTGFIGAAFGSFSEYYAQIQRTIGATERIRELLNEPTEPVNAPETDTHKLRTPLQGKVEFQSVSFRYPSRTEVEVLADVSFTVQPGQQVALVGPSGAGKSTVAGLLLRFHTPQTGTILFDSQAADSYDLTHLRQHLAIVPQDVYLFGGTIRQNIAYGKLDATDAEIRVAAQQANALEFIDQFPQGLDTLVGERGIKLSGGQRQRIAIARAVLRNPTILILDEATSSLDSESERLVQEALDRLMKGRTTFVIAHRLSTIRQADQILVLDHGCVVEAGTHTELMTIPNGLYAQLAGLQFQKLEQ